MKPPQPVNEKIILYKHSLDSEGEVSGHYTVSPINSAYCGDLLQPNRFLSPLHFSESLSSDNAEKEKQCIISYMFTSIQAAFPWS